MHGDGGRAGAGFACGRRVEKALYANTTSTRQGVIAGRPLGEISRTAPSLVFEDAIPPPQAWRRRGYRTGNCSSTHPSPSSGRRYERPPTRT